VVENDEKGRALDVNGNCENAMKVEIREKG
jgi:hypothetical protein